MGERVFSSEQELARNKTKVSYRQWITQAKILKLKVYILGLFLLNTTWGVFLLEAEG